MTTGLILAGGKSSRFKGDKAKAVLAGRSLLDWVCLRAAPQVDRLLFNARARPETGLAATLPWVPDLDQGFKGPLAGVYAGMKWLAEHDPACAWLATFPVDSPFFPVDHITRLEAHAETSSRPVIAKSGGRAHPVFALWPVLLLPELEKTLAQKEMKGVGHFAEKAGAIFVDISGAGFDPYFNLNTKEDLDTAEVIAKRYFDHVS